MARAVKMAANVKDSPHQAILRLAAKLTGAGLDNPTTVSNPCCGDQTGADDSSGNGGRGKDAPGANNCCG
jgi:hypothetical protein